MVFPVKGGGLGLLPSAHISGRDDNLVKVNPLLEMIGNKQVENDGINKNRYGVPRF